jgi:hypothetical protein
MRSRKPRWLIGAAGLAALAALTAGQTVAARQGPAGSARADYVVVYERSAGLKAAREAVSAAGGRLVKENQAVGGSCAARRPMSRARSRGRTSTQPFRRPGYPS